MILFFLVAMASAIPSCFNNTLVNDELVYLCGLSCDQWWYYKHTFTMQPNTQC